jgi:hypothetical protein
MRLCVGQAAAVLLALLSSCGGAKLTSIFDNASPEGPGSAGAASTQREGQEQQTTSSGATTMETDASSAAGAPLPAAGGASVAGASGVSGAPTDPPSTVGDGGKAGASSGGTASSDVGGSAPQTGGGGVGGSTLSECQHRGDGKSTVMVVNQCDKPLSFRSNAGDAGELLPGAQACHDLGNTTDVIPAVRYWGYTGVDPGAGRHSLAVLELNTTYQALDFYDISYVDAQNLPLAMAPLGMPGCRNLTCSASLLQNCPPVGQLKDDAGQIIACTNPDNHNPNSPVAQYFNQGCGDAYAWTGDDAEALTACAGEDYAIVFCPTAEAGAH